MKTCKKNNQQVKFTGATKGAENVKINLAPDEEDIQKLDAFAKQLVEKAAKLND